MWWNTLGLMSAGIEPVWANEINETACELYSQVVKKNTIEHANICDIDIFKKADILAGCYPCQGYSQGGRRNTDDGINYLYQEFDRALRQIRPLAFIVENVDGMSFSHNEPLLNNQLTRFRLAGYRVSWKVLDAVRYGLAQERRRLFIVGIRSAEGKKFTFPQPTHGNEEGQLPPLTLRDVIWDLRDAPQGSYNEEPFHWYYLSRDRGRWWTEQSPCIVAHWRHLGLHPDSPPLERMGTDKWRFKYEGFARRYSYLEAAALQGFSNPHAFMAGSPAQRARAIGNAVPPPLFGAVAKALVQQLQFDQRRVSQDHPAARERQH
jgi:DNA (cytosine-5)-methyltransferase 1